MTSQDFITFIGIPTAMFITMMGTSVGFGYFIKSLKPSEIDIMGCSIVLGIILYLEGAFFVYAMYVRTNDFMNSLRCIVNYVILPMFIVACFVGIWKFIIKDRKDLDSKRYLLASILTILAAGLCYVMYVRLG